MELEKRLVTLEVQQRSSLRQTDALLSSVGELKGSVAGMKSTLDETQADVKEMKGEVARQNGRVGKLEVWRSQEAAFIAAVLAAAPFVFYGLTKLFGA